MALAGERKSEATIRDALARLHTTTTTTTNLRTGEKDLTKSKGGERKACKKALEKRQMTKPNAIVLFYLHASCLPWNRKYNLPSTFHLRGLNLLRLAWQRAEPLLRLWQK